MACAVFGFAVGTEGLVFALPEFQHNTIDAPSLSGWRWAVLKYMPLVKAADRTMTLGARQEHFEIAFGSDHAF